MQLDTVRASASTLGWLTLAVLAHGVSLLMVPSVPEQRARAQALEEVSFEILQEVQAPPVEETSEVAQDTETIAPPPEAKTPKPPPEPVETTPKPPAAADETPIEFDNVTLTNKAGGGEWAITDSSGIDREGPIGRPDAVVSGQSRLGQAGGVVGGTGSGVIMDVGDLSRAPRPPDLKRKLERNYPKRAKADGVEGESKVRLQINPDGSSSGFRSLAEKPSGYEFSDACIRTLHGERWAAPVDKSGNRVATRVSYTCRFTIRR